MSKVPWLAGAIAALCWAQTKAPSPTLNELVRKPYQELVTLIPHLTFSQREIDDFRKKVEAQKKEDVDSLEAEKKTLKSNQEEIYRLLDELNKAASTDDAAAAARRADLHCRLFRIEKDLRDRKAERSISVAVEYDQRLTKLDLIAQWPARRIEIDQAKSTGRARQRRHGDVEDIGYRKVGEGQDADIKLGEDAVNELRSYHMLPPECDSKPLRDYVRQLGDRLAASSDLKVPLNVTVLDTDEVNAFGLPGGRLLVDAGLVEAAAGESELAGVLAHEIAHIAARHGEKLTRPTASIPKLLLQGATMAADSFTSGAVSQAQQAAHDVLGLGVKLNLALLGVGKDSEAEAGQLGTQYLWHAGIDPRGFIYFYDRLASDPNHARTASFFRTHPPNGERALLTLAELEYLPQKPVGRRNSPAFQRAHALAEAWLKGRSREKEAAGMTPPPGCAVELDGAAAAPAGR